MKRTKLIKLISKILIQLFLVLFISVGCIACGDINPPPQGRIEEKEYINPLSERFNDPQLVAESENNFALIYGDNINRIRTNFEKSCIHLTSEKGTLLITGTTEACGQDISSYYYVTNTLSYKQAVVLKFGIKDLEDFFIGFANAFDTFYFK